MAEPFLNNLICSINLEDILSVIQLFSKKSSNKVIKAMAKE
jgi:hypothetical protein